MQSFKLIQENERTNTEAERNILCKCWLVLAIQKSGSAAGEAVTANGEAVCV
jgi:hypothetical protein